MSRSKQFYQVTTGVTAVLTLVLGVATYRQSDSLHEAKQQVTTVTNNYDASKGLADSLKQDNEKLNQDNKDLQTRVDQLPNDTGGTDSTPGQVVHLADPTSRSEDILVDNTMDELSNLGINGKHFDLGWSRILYFETAPAVVVGINPNGEYARFRGRIGLDSTSGNNSARVQVTADGKPILTKTVTLTKSTDFDLPIANVVRLELKVYPPEKPEMRLAVGDPTLAK